MPVYEYKCMKCEDIIEKFQSMRDDPLTECPKCSGELKKLISTNSINVLYGPREHLEKEIRPEARRIAERIKAGDENAAADLFGVNE